MTIFTRRTLNNAEIGLLKASVLALGLVIGSHWPDIFIPYTLHLIAVAGVLGVYLLSVWVKRN